MSTRTHKLLAVGPPSSCQHLSSSTLVNTKGMGVETDGTETWVKYKTKRKPEEVQRQLLSLTHVIEPQPEPKRQRQSNISEFLVKM